MTNACFNHRSSVRAADWQRKANKRFTGGRFAASPRLYPMPWEAPVSRDGSAAMGQPRWINSIETFCGAVRKAIVTPGRIVVGSIVKVTPLLFSSATALWILSTVMPK